MVAVQQVIDTNASDLESSALNGVLLYGLGVSGLVLFVLVLAWIVVRSVNKPLRALTAAARDVAEVRLPALVATLEQGGEQTARHIEELKPIHVASKDEIGELAQAFTTIQQVTAHVAEEQSALLRKGIGDLYVNLARRNQSLLDRQISLLDEMESQAEDSDQLGALFELDHLADAHAPQRGEPAGHVGCRAAPPVERVDPDPRRRPRRDRGDHRLRPGELLGLRR